MNRKNLIITIKVLSLIIIILVGILIYQNLIGNRSRSKALPVEARNKIDVRGAIREGLLGWGFYGSIYNGSDWIINGMIVSIVAKGKDGTIKWDRKYNVRMTPISPLYTGDFGVKIDYEDNCSFESYIVSTRGSK